MPDTKDPMEWISRTETLLNSCNAANAKTPLASILNAGLAMKFTLEAPSRKFSLSHSRLQTSNGITMDNAHAASE